MPATVFLCERNGVSPGIATENINVVTWKATDNSNENFTSVDDVLVAGTNSYEKYQYLKFAGDFTSLENVRFHHTSVSFPVGVKLYCSPSVISSTGCQSYSKPVRTTSTKATVDITSTGRDVTLVVGPAVEADPASGTDKEPSYLKGGNEALYSNYIVTQLRTNNAAESGEFEPVVLTVSYDET